MRLLRHWKMILGLAALYGAGCFTGAVALLIFAVTHPSPETLNRWVNFRMAEYDRKLKLRPEQKAKIKPIVETTRTQIRAVVRSGLEQTAPLLDAAQQQIKAELTPAQQAQFEKLNRDTLKRLRDFAQKDFAKPVAAGAVPVSPP